MDFVMGGGRAWLHIQNYDLKNKIKFLDLYIYIQSFRVMSQYRRSSTFVINIILKQ